MQTENFFTAGSPYLEHPLLTPERTAREIDFVVSHLELPLGGRILDVGCGPGRHSLELSRRGYQVVGIDPSADMIAAARQRAADAGVTAAFLQARGEDLHLGELLSEQRFDGAICLFTTLGQMVGKDDNRALVSEVARVLKPGGGFIVEIPQRAWTVANLKTADRFGDTERYTEVHRRYDPHERCITETFTVSSPEDRRTYLLRYRVFSSEEASRILANAGFEIVASFGGYGGEALENESPVMIFVTRSTLTVK